MTLAPISGSFRPGAPTVPQALSGISGSGAAEAAHLQFLSAEERTTAVLMGYFQDARLELEAFIRTGDLSVSDATYYRKLLDETNRIASKVNAQGAEWTSSVIPEGYSAGWRQNSSVVVPQKALQALAGDTLSLISQTSDGIRQSVRQAIAQGILQGLPADAVRQRIIATGLTNIPRWPSVEYRAGVIARTETMRAYNAGNLAAIEENGARFAEWIASPDEAVCAICMPRDGVVFRLGEGWSGPGDDPYPAALPLPKLPAHPRCRCTFRAVYRRPDGQVIGTPNEQEAALPLDAMGGREKPIVPPAKGDIPKALAGLRRDFDAFLAGGRFPDATRAFWRSLDLDDDTIRLIVSQSGAKDHVRRVMFVRYGITFNTKGAWRPAGMSASLRALEHFRRINQSWVVDSPYLTHWGSAPAGARKMSGNRAAEMYATCHMRPNFTAMRRYEDVIDGYKIGVDDTVLNVLVHELGHSIHNRYGLHSSGSLSRYAAIEFGGIIGDATTGMSSPNYLAAVAHREKLEAPWAELRRQSVAVAASGSTKDVIAALEARIAKYEAELASGASFAPTATKNLLELAKGNLQKLRAITPGAEHYPTDYARTGGYAEDFAESLMLYVLNPTHLKTWSPGRYALLREVLGLPDA